jgi:ATP-dependent helicase/nuclease subunit B
VNLFSIPPDTPFLDALAAEWLAQNDDPLEIARGVILLPTRRAARALADAFLRGSGGRPLLLPRITAFGALDEAPLALSGVLDLQPAVQAAQRLAALSRLILELRGANGAPRTADRAWSLAEELANLMDEAERAEIDLTTRLPDAADPAYAAHWAQTLKFLHIVTGAWPHWLAERGMINPGARLVALLNGQAAAWQAKPPDYRVLVAGTTAGIPAVARLLKVIARLPTGAVVLPGLDSFMDDETWGELEHSHPQAGLAELLHGLGATRGDVRPWPTVMQSAVPPMRAATLARALLPAGALDAWSDVAPVSIDGMWRLSASDHRKKPPPSPWCCATRWRRQVRRRRWSHPIETWPGVWPPSYCVTAWWPMTAPVRSWRRRRRRCSFACSLPRSPNS